MTESITMTDSMKLQWLAEFTNECKEMRKLTAPVEYEGWLPFKKLWRWKNDGTH